jgi:hypothetical protein
LLVTAYIFMMYFLSLKTCSFSCFPCTSVICSNLMFSFA